MTTDNSSSRFNFRNENYTGSNVSNWDAGMEAEQQLDKHSQQHMPSITTQHDLNTVILLSISSKWITILSSVLKCSSWLHFSTENKMMPFDLQTPLPNDFDDCTTESTEYHTYSEETKATKEAHRVLFPYVILCTLFSFEALATFQADKLFRASVHELRTQVTRPEVLQHRLQNGKHSCAILNGKYTHPYDNIRIISFYQAIIYGITTLK